MIPKGSRYETAEHHFVKAHLYNDWGYPLLEGELGRTTLTLRLQNRDTLYAWVAQYTAPPLASVFVKQIDNMPYLASRIYQDSKRWTDIAAANPHIWYPLDMKMGDLLRIPGA